MLWKLVDLFVLKEYTENNVVYYVNYVIESHVFWFTQR
jgi:hypothetical protein